MRFIAGLLLCLCFVPLKAQQLSPQARISLLTIAQGQDLYSTFGHSAFRVQDPAQGMDIVFNYGTFDFEAAGFYLKFMQGKLDYLLTVDQFTNLLAAAQEEQRSVRMQLLNLSAQQAQRLFAFLVLNAQPERRAYRYDFFFDNCATRLRDALLKSLGQEVHFVYPNPAKAPNFRQLIAPYLQTSPWASLGINLCLGAPVDRPAVGSEFVFLPDSLAAAFGRAHLAQGGGMLPLVTQSFSIYAAAPAPPTNLLNPAWVIGLLVFVALAGTYFAMKGKALALYRWFCMAYLFIVGLLGCILLFLWLGTDHTATHPNWNLLWAWPTHLVIAFYLRRKPLPVWVRYYMLAAAISIALAFLIALVSLFMPIQQIPPQAYLLMLGLLGMFLFWFFQSPASRVSGG